MPSHRQWSSRRVSCQSAGGIYPAVEAHEYPPRLLICRDEACVHSEPFTADQAFLHTPLQNCLEQMPQDIALPEPAMPMRENVE